MVNRGHASLMRAGVGAAVLFVSVGIGSAQTVPFTEDFESDAANWFDNAGTSPVDWNAAGGPDGSSFALTSFNFINSAATDAVVLFRAQEEFNSSGGAFVGDWISSGVDSFSVFLRHDLPADHSFFVRFASPFNFPGALGRTPELPSGLWHEVTFPIGPSAPLFYEGPSTFASVFGNVGHVQIGLNAPDSVAGVDQAFTFGIDQATITPEPGALTLLLLGIALAGPQKRRPRHGKEAV